MELDPKVRARRAKWESRSKHEQVTIYDLPTYNTQVIAVNNNNFAIIVCKGIRPYEAFKDLSYIDVRDEEYSRPVSAWQLTTFKTKLRAFIRAPKEFLPDRDDQFEWKDKFGAVASLLHGFKTHPKGIPSGKDRNLMFSHYFEQHSTHFPAEALPIADKTSNALENALRRGTINGFPKDDTPTMHAAAKWLDERDNALC